VLVELAKTRFYRTGLARTQGPPLTPDLRRERHLRRRLSRFVHVVPPSGGPGPVDRVPDHRAGSPVVAPVGPPPGDPAPRALR
jgi:hypothetical protein